MATGIRPLKVVEGFTIPVDEELVKMPVDFKLKVNLYWVATIVRDIIYRNQDKPAIPQKLLVDLGITMAFGYSESEIAASYVCSTINYWTEIRLEDQRFFVTNFDKLFQSENIKPGTFTILFTERLITPDEIKKTWAYLNTMIRQSIRWMAQLLKGNERIILCEKLGDGSQNPNAVTMDWPKLKALAKVHDVTDV